MGLLIQMRKSSQLYWESASRTTGKAACRGSGPEEGGLDTDKGAVKTTCKRREWERRRDADLQMSCLVDDVWLQVTKIHSKYCACDEGKSTHHDSYPTSRVFAVSSDTSNQKVGGMRQGRRRYTRGSCNGAVATACVHVVPWFGGMTTLCWQPHQEWLGRKAGRGEVRMGLLHWRGGT